MQWWEENAEKKGLDFGLRGAWRRENGAGIERR